jgi:hypothetical protein
VPPPEHRSDTFAQRARREADRFRLATDSEYWIAFCFRTPQGRQAFADTTGADLRHRVPGGKLPQQPARRDPRPRAIRMLMARSTRNLDTAAVLNQKPPPDPLAKIPVTSDLATDCTAELAAIFAALTAPPDPSPVNVLDSPHHVIAWWPHRDAKDSWLAATTVEILGDKYVDGHQAAVILGITTEGK